MIDVTQMTISVILMVAILKTTVTPTIWQILDGPTAKLLLGTFPNCTKFHASITKCKISSYYVCLLSAVLLGNRYVWQNSEKLNCSCEHISLQQLEKAMWFVQKPWSLSRKRYWNVEELNWVSHTENSTSFTKICSVYNDVGTIKLVVKGITCK